MNSSALLLDTHVWLKYGLKSSSLQKATIDRIDDALAIGSAFVSVISVWEVAMLVRDGRFTIQGSMERWANEALALTGLQLLQFSPQIAIASVSLPEPMHKDPADRILVASAQVERLTLITADKAILSFAKHMGLSFLRA